MKKKTNWKYVLMQFESYIAAVIFIVICLLMLAQVVGRYVFNHSITWAEELSVLLFVPMIYCGFAAAVTNRKHICVEAVQAFVPFKVKKTLKITSEFIFLFFCIYMQKPLFGVIKNLGSSVTDLLRIPKIYVYIEIPILLILVAIRIVQNIVRLWHEDETNLGKTKPTIDLDVCEREAIENKKRDNILKEGE
ncbi:MAG: TRAP transporter small permease [Oscillospiraceae bacterium]